MKPRDTKPLQGVVCVPGWCCRSDDFIPLFTVLEKEASPDSQVCYIAVDLPGHGQTPPSKLPEVNLASLAGLMIRFCQALQLENVILAGHSMGHRIVQLTAAFALGYNSPDQQRPIIKETGSEKPLGLRGLILLDPTNFDLLRRSTSAANATAQASETGLATWKAMFGPDTPTDFQESSISHFQSRDNTFKANLREKFRAFDYTNHDEVSTFIGQSGELPVLSINGTTMLANHQRASFKEASERSEYMDWLVKRIPTASQRVVIDSGHFPHIDRTEDCAEFINQFVTEVFGSSR